MLFQKRDSRLEAVCFAVEQRPQMTGSPARKPQKTKPEISPDMLIDLSDRAKYRATGKDGARFLNGQLTNDILTLRPGSAIAACALTAKGKLCADLSVAATSEGYYLDAESVLRESLAARLEKYIIADDVILEDVTDEFGLFHLTDAGSPLPLGGIDLFQIQSI